MTTIVRPRNPAELAVVLPYQLGYHPGPSVVVTVLHERRLGLVQRHDLPADPGDCRDAARHAMAIAAREGATSVLLIAHEDAPGDSAPLSEAMLEVATEEGIGVQERIVVRDGRWYSPDCRQDCCPHDGLPLPRPEDVPAVAPFVHAGVAPLPSRSAIVDGVLPPRDEERSRSVGLHLASLGLPSLTSSFGGGTVEPAHRWPERGVDVVQWWSHLLDPRPQAAPVADLSDEALAWLACSLRDVTWRDALMATLSPGALPADVTSGSWGELAAFAASWCPWVPDGHPVEGGDEGASVLGPPACSPEQWYDEVLAVRARLVELTRLLPSGATPPVFTLVAHLAWWSGDGTVAGICLEQALQIDPDHRLADLMLRLLSAGVRPWSDTSDDASGQAA